MDILLRPWSTKDLKDLVHYANNFNVSKFMTNKFPYPYTNEAGITFITYATMDKPTHIFAIEIDGHAVGGIGVHLQTDIQQKNAELGYWLAEPYWGKGIISQAIKEIIPFAFNTYDIVRLFARPFGNNIASQRVLEKAGFTLEARIEKGLYKNEEFQDELIYAIRR